ncbi:MAG TPA: leucyl aminopeptidase [Actinomycetota bacterium]
MPTFSIVKAGAADAAVDVLAVPVLQGLKAGPGVKDVERALGSTVAELAEHVPVLSLPDRRFTGKLGEAILVTTLGKLPATQVLFVGLGESATGAVARKAGAVAARRAGGGSSLATTIPQAFRGKADAAVAAFVEGFLLGSYRFAKYKAEQDTNPNRIAEVRLLAGKSWDARAVTGAIKRAETIAAGTIFARDLTNTPSFDKSPETLADAARSIAKNGLKLKVFTEKELEAKGFGGLLGVGRGSRRPPRLIELSYEPAGARRTIAFVGKGITFDSGGINLKPGEGMDAMKMDMGGGAAVLGAMMAIADLKPKVAVRAYVATAENMPGGNAIRPGDVIRQYGGKTTEIGNTDAEGRVVMADAIVYAKERGADVVIDVATLTGACAIALGTKVFGVMGDPRTETKKVLDAAERAGEQAWELPLVTDYKKLIKSELADVRNVGSRREGGAITAGLFLKEFAGDTPWVHLDIAGPMGSDEDEFEFSKGATGVGVRTLVEYALAQR